MTVRDPLMRIVRKVLGVRGVRHLYLVVRSFTDGVRVGQLMIDECWWGGCHTYMTYDVNEKKMVALCDVVHVTEIDDGVYKMFKRGKLDALRDWLCEELTSLKGRAGYVSGTCGWKYTDIVKAVDTALRNYVVG